jgi:hypothetical protein
LVEAHPQNYSEGHEGQLRDKGTSKQNGHEVSITDVTRSSRWNDGTAHSSGFIFWKKESADWWQQKVKWTQRI